jgi:hypothetical protein
MTADDIATLRYIHDAAEECRPIGDNNPEVKLGKSPDEIIYFFDLFLAMHGTT